MLLRTRFQNCSAVSLHGTQLTSIVTLHTDGTDVHGVAGGGNGANYASSVGSPDWQPLH